MARDFVPVPGSGGKYQYVLVSKKRGIEETYRVKFGEELLTVFVTDESRVRKKKVDAKNPSGEVVTSILLTERRPRYKFSIDGDGGGVQTSTEHPLTKGSPPAVFEYLAKKR